MTENGSGDIVIFSTETDKIITYSSLFCKIIKEGETKMAVLVEERKATRYRVGPANTGPYPAHMHDPVEVVIIRKGYLSMTVNGTLYVLEPNTVIMVFPGMIHSYESASEDAEGLFVGFTPDSIDEFRSTLTSMWPVNPVVRISECPEDLDEAIRKLEGYSGREGTFPLMLPYIHVMAACLLTKLELVPSEKLHNNSFMYNALQYIQQHSNENLTLDSVAKELGVGGSYLSHLFSQKMKVNFRKFLNTIRIEKACVLLEDSPMSIKEICFEVGFENTRTFHRVFMEEQKMTPGEYRERMRKGLVIPLQAR